MKNEHKSILTEGAKKQIREAQDMSILLPNWASIRVVRNGGDEISLATAFPVHKEVESDEAPLNATSWHFNSVHLRNLAEVLNFIADTMEACHD